MNASPPRGAALERQRRSSREPLRDDRARRWSARDALLLQRVAVAHRHRAVLHRLAVDRDAERRADLVLPAIAPADRARLVVEHREALRADPSAMLVAPSPACRPSSRAGRRRLDRRERRMQRRAPCALRPRPRPSPRDTRSRAPRASCDRRRPTSRRRTAGSACCSADRSTRASCPRYSWCRARSKSPRLWTPSISWKPSVPPKSNCDVERRARVVRELCPSCADGSAAAPDRGRATCATPCRCAFQYSNHSMSVPGSTKNCISICSNSRVRKMKLPGVISLRNALPICAMPNGTFWRVDCCTFRKFT